MSQPSRRLAVIMVGDIVGFTAQMAIDERQALAYVGRMRQTVKPLLEANDGQWIKDIGDGFLTSFDSAVEAVNCAVAIQRALRDDPEFQLRLGIHLGDVVFEDGDMMGDGVNVAARLEMLAVPGGICASGQVVDLVRNQPDLRTARLGVTNLPHQVEAYAIASSDLPLPTVAESLDSREDHARGKIDLVDAAASLERDALRRAVRRWRMAVGALGLALLVGAALTDPIARLMTLARGGAMAVPIVLVADAGHAPTAADAADPDAPLRLSDLAAPGDDDVRLSARFNDLLRRTLAERRAVSVVADADVRALMPRLRLPEGSALTPALARQVASRDPNIRAVLAGDVRQVGPRFTLSVDLVEPATGATLGAWTADAADAADLLPAMRRLADDAAAGAPAALAVMPTPPAERDARSPALAVTTANAAALAPFGEAVAAARGGRWRVAHDRAVQAAAEDPDFAMAHVLTAEAERRLGRIPSPQALTRAGALTPTLPAGERELVRAAVLRGAGDCRGAVDALEAAASAAPALAEAYADFDLTSLGLALACANRATDAVAALEARTAAHPDDPAPANALLRVHLATTADIAAARRAALTLARRSFEPPDALALSFPAIELAVNARLAEGSAQLATAAARAVDDDVLPIRLAFQRAALAAAGGDVAGAAEHTRQAADLSERHAATQWQAAALWQLGWLDRLRGDESGWARRLAELAAAFPPSVAAGADAWRLADRARAGDAGAPAAFRRDVAPRLADGREREAFAGYIAGQLAMARQDPAAARVAFASALAAAPEPAAEPPTIGLRPGVADLALAEAEAALGGAGAPDALRALQRLRDRPLPAFADPLAVGAVTWLQGVARSGRLLEAAGDRDAAVAAYETALRWWGESTLADGAAVRARVAALTGAVR